MDETGLPDRYVASLEAGNRSLAAGEWEAAFEGFQAALACAETPEALEGLAMAAWWLDDAPTLFDCRKRAFSLYRRAGDSTGAARIATWLGLDYYTFEHSPAVANGWLNRAWRLLESIESPSFEHCFIEFSCGHIALEDHDIEAAESHALNMISFARSLGIIDFEMLGLALHGLIDVSRGNVDTGMRQLDEAVTAALAGELTDPDAIVTSCCYLFYACERVRDVKRATQWCEILTSLCQRWSYRSMVSVCKAHYAGVLVWQGKWDLAEQELVVAARELIAGRAGWSQEAILRLADLKRLQGRREEARKLFADAAEHPLSLIGRAELALDERDLATATDLANRYLRRIQEDDLSARIPGLDVLARTAIAEGDLLLADRCVTELEGATNAIGTEPYRARLAHFRGLTALASADYSEARSNFEDAVDLFESCGVPFEIARSRLELARTLDLLGRSTAATVECRAALESFERLGARPFVVQASELLRTIASRSVMAAEVPLIYPGLTQRESEILSLISQGLTNLEIADRLYLSIRTVERHVSSIYQKIGAEGRAARAIAVAYAVEHGPSASQ